MSSYSRHSVKLQSPFLKLIACNSFSCTSHDHSHHSSRCLFRFHLVKPVKFPSTNNWDGEANVMSMSVYLHAASAPAKLMHFNRITVQNCLPGFVSLTAAVIGQSDAIKCPGCSCTVCSIVLDNKAECSPQVKERCLCMCVCIMHSCIYLMRDRKPNRIQYFYTICVLCLLFPKTSMCRIYGITCSCKISR